MPRHYFSTGLLTAYLAVAGTISAASIGQTDDDAMIIAAIMGNAGRTGDADPATQTVLQITNATNGEFLILDLGKSQTVEAVRLTNVTKTGAVGTVSCWVSNTLSTTNLNPAVGARLGTTQGVGASVSFQGVGRTGRYVYIYAEGVTGAGSLRIGEASVSIGSQIVFAELQNITMDVKYNQKQLRGPTSVTNFAVDVAHYDGEVSAKAEWADIKQSAITAIVAAAIDGGSPGVLTMNGAVSLPSFDATFEGKSTDDKTIRLHLPKCYAPGLHLPFKRDDWAMASMDITAYLTDGADGSTPVAIWEIQQ